MLLGFVGEHDGEHRAATSMSELSHVTVLAKNKGYRLAFAVYGIRALAGSAIVVSDGALNSSREVDPQWKTTFSPCFSDNLYPLSCREHIKGLARYNKRTILNTVEAPNNVRHVST